MDANDGGPAFPTPDTYHPSGQVQHGCYGMSLRDWFAGHALAGMLAAEPYCTSDSKTFAIASYALADAMLKQREAKL